jgi:hypothetical protein
MKLPYAASRNRWCLLLLGLLMACAKEASISPSCSAPYVAPVPADVYASPIRPGMPAWALLTTTAEMVQVLQVPSGVLQSISTPGLLATCLDYPLLPDILLANRLQRGTRNVLANFNGYDELRQRPDAAALLLSRYQLMTPSCFPEQAKQGAYSFGFSCVEMMLAQDEYLAQLSATQRRALLREALTKYAEKKSLVGQVYGYFSLKTAAFVMARVMQAEQFRPFTSAMSTDSNLQVFTTEAEFYGKPQTLDTVLKYAQQFN